jgi:hypothetical protein
MTKLYRVQTTGDAPETVDIIDTQFGYGEFHGTRAWRHNGEILCDPRPNLKLTTRVPLHILSDEDLRKRDEALLERVSQSVFARRVGHMEAGEKLYEMDDSDEGLAAIDAKIEECNAIRAEIEAMKRNQAMNADQIKALLERLCELSKEANEDRNEEYIDAVATGERPDIFDWDVEIALNDLDALLFIAQAALTITVERDTITTENEALRKRVAELETIASAWAETAQHCEILEGVCCCGDSMENHPNPMNCGHSPVDHGAYHAGQLLTQTRAILKGTPDAKP